MSGELTAAAGETKVGQFDGLPVSYEQVFALEIPVSDVQAVQILDGLTRVVKEISGQIIGNGALCLPIDDKPVEGQQSSSWSSITTYSDKIEQIAILGVLHENEDLGARVVDLVGFDDVLVADSAQNVELPWQELSNKVLGSFTPVDNLHRQKLLVRALVSRRAILGESF